MTLRTYQHALNKVFSRDYQFEVPSFQRPYVWDTDQASQLLEDLRSAMETPDVPYFLGSLVLVSTDGGRRDVMVIDGQQRLTTLTIILSVLRYLEDDTEIREPLNEMLLEPGNKLSDIKPEPRLRLRNVDAGFLRDFIQEDGTEELFDLMPSELATNAQERMWENYRVIHDQVADTFTPAERQNLARYLSNGVNLVLVISDDVTSAHRVFNVLNTRGLPLSAADILKSEVIGLAPESERDVMATLWDSCLQKASEDSDRFLQDLFVVITKQESKGAIAEEYNTHVLPDLGDDASAKFVDDYLSPYSTIAHEISLGESSVLGKEANFWLKRLTDYPIREWVPAAMWIINHYGGTDDAALLLKNLERATGVDSVARTSAGARRARINRFLRSLEDARANLRLLEHALQQLGIDDRTRRRAIAHLRGEHSANAALTKALLLRANIQDAGGDQTWPRQFNVGQIIPSKVVDPSNWPAMSESNRDYWSSRLANLVLTRASAKELHRVDSFQERRDLFTRKGHLVSFPLTEELAGLPFLRPDELDDRQESTISLLADFWDIRHDSDGVDLTTLSEEQLTAIGSGVTGSRGRRITLREVQAKGLLRAGDRFIWERPQIGETLTAVLVSDGFLQLPDGSLHSTPSAAAKAASGGSSVSGVEVWKRTSDGTRLKDIFTRYRRSVLGTD